MCVECAKGARSTNVYKLLRHREYSIISNSRLNMRVMRCLVCKEDSKFQCVWRKLSNSPISYEDGHLYFNNYKECYSTSGPQGLPDKIYSLPSCPSGQKIEDGLVCQCPLAEMPMEHRGWRPHFLALTANNWLIRYDLKTGETLQRIFISTHYKFKHISWDIEQTQVVIKSTFIQRPAVANQNLLLALACFTVFPLEFVGMFEMKRSVFGTSLVDAMICQGALITMHSGDRVRIHDLQEALTLGRTSKVALHQYWAPAEGVVGTYPTGVPLNCNLKEEPRVLFEVRCADHNLTLGGIPWHYIINAYKSRGRFEVYSLESGKMAEEGSLDSHTLSVEPDKCIFHPDDSGRVLHVSCNEISVLQIQEKSSLNEYKVALQFQINARSLNSYLNTQPKVRNATKTKLEALRQALEQTKTAAATYSQVHRTSSGRSIKRRQDYADSVDGSIEKAIAGCDYENDLEVLVITTTHQDGDKMLATVHLLDNDTGQVLQRIPFQEHWIEFCEHMIIADVDVILHIVKAPARKFECILYRLDRRLVDAEDMNAARSKPLPARRSRRR